MDDCSLLTPRAIGGSDWLAGEADQEIDIDQRVSDFSRSGSQLLAAAGRCPRLYFTKYG